MLIFYYYYNKFIRFRQSCINFMSWVSYSYFSLRQHAFSVEPFPQISHCQPVFVIPLHNIIIHHFSVQKLYRLICPAFPVNFRLSGHAGFVVNHAFVPDTRGASVPTRTCRKMQGVASACGSLPAVLCDIVKRHLMICTFFLFTNTDTFKRRNRL